MAMRSTHPEALAVHRDGHRDGEVLAGEVVAGWDVFGIPHGGYLAALAGSAVLADTGAPDLFTITVHYLRKAVHGPITFTVVPVGGSRRFTTVTATAIQEGQPVLAVMASVGDRSRIEGPTWLAAPPASIPEDRLSAPAGDPGLPFTAPSVAERLGLRLDARTVGFATGRSGPHADLRGVIDVDPADELVALIACDLTPPAVWNVLGAQGWVPTVELTAHVRSTPLPGPMTIDVTTRHVADGFLEEDALVHDAAGRLVVQSRQLARWTAAG